MFKKKKWGVCLFEFSGHKCICLGKNNFGIVKNLNSVQVFNVHDIFIGFISPDEA